MIPASKVSEGGTRAPLTAVIPASKLSHASASRTQMVLDPACDQAQASSDAAARLPTTSKGHRLLYHLGILPSPETQIKIAIRRKCERKDISDELVKREQLLEELKKKAVSMDRNVSFPVRSRQLGSSEHAPFSAQRLSRKLEEKNNLSSSSSHRLRARRAFWQHDDFLPTCVIDSSSEED